MCSEKGTQRITAYEWEHLEVFTEEGEKISRFSHLERGTGTLPIKHNKFEFSGYSKNDYQPEE